MNSSHPNPETGSTLAHVLFTVELYHLVGHIVVLLGLRLLPRKDLVRQRLYFLTDLLSVHLSFWVHRRWWGLVLLQNIQHAFYFITWDKRYERSLLPGLDSMRGIGFGLLS